MKKHHFLLLTFFVLALLSGCKKNSNNPGGGGNGGGGGGGTNKPKKWYIKSFASKQDASHFAHTVFVYDTAKLITKTGYGLSALKDTFDQSMQQWTDYTYDKDGKLVSSKPFQAPGLHYTYLTSNSIQVTPFPYDPAHDGVAYYNFNAHSHGELDQIKSVIPPGNLFAGTTANNYLYNDLGGIQAESDMLADQSSQDAWAFYSPNAVAAIDNPFSNGTTMEQRFIYAVNDPSGVWDVLGPKWSNGVYENYSYRTGVKVPQAHFWNQYKVDANGNVVEVTRQYVSLEDPKQTVITANTVYITYEQH